MEGGVHQNLVRKFGSFGAGPELADTMLAEYRLRHNIDVGTKNRYGHEYKGHYNPWIIQHIDLLRQELNVDSNNNSKRYLALDMNALKYRESKEVYGICPLPTDELIRLKIERRDGFDEEDGEEKYLTIPKLEDSVFLSIESTLRATHNRYNYIANKQETRYAVITVHTMEEVTLFSQLLSQLFQANSKPNFDLLEAKWNVLVDGINIFYKTPEHLEKHYNHWKEQETAKKTHVAHYNIILTIQSKIRSTNVPHSLLPARSPTLPSYENIVSMQNIRPIQIMAMPPIQDRNIPSIAMPTPIALPLPNISFSMRPILNSTMNNHPINNGIPIQPYIRAPPLSLSPIPSNQTSQTNIDAPRTIVPSLIRKRICKGCGNQTCPGNSNEINVEK